jgi:beta-phosphoglucomutase-like phosphatase (HAD superfamily)
LIEDAPSGVSAAKAAGMCVVAVATTYRESDLSKADAVAAALTEVRVSHLTDRGDDDTPRFELRVSTR